MINKRNQKELTYTRGFVKMISFREYFKEQLLLEYDQAITLQNFGEKLEANKDAYLKGKSAEEILKKLEDCDPTKKKTYTQWIVKQFLNGIKYEDLSSTGKDWLSFFDTNKQKLPAEYKDINKLNFGKLGDLFLEYKDEELASNRQKKIDTKLKGAKKIFEDSDWTVIVPLNKEAACLYGANTKWCTAATKGENKFDEYTSSEEYRRNEKEKSQLYIFIPKNPKRKNEKYQVHIESMQITDERDEILYNDPTLIKKFLDIIGKHSKINYNFSQIKTEFGIEFDDEDTKRSENLDSMMFMFYGAPEVPKSISKWNTSKVLNMEQAFAYSDIRNDADITKWDVSKVTNMESMFEGSDFNQDISNWNVKSVSNIKSLFRSSKVEKNEPLFKKIILAWRKKNPIFNEIKLPGE